MNQLCVEAQCGARANKNRSREIQFPAPFSLLQSTQWFSVNPDIP